MNLLPFVTSKIVAPIRYFVRSNSIYSVTCHVVIMWLIVPLAGCGYSTRRPFTDDFRTVHVEMFQSRDFRRELEFQLSEALVKRIEMDTPYRIAPLKRADVLIEGEILSVEQQSFGADFRFDQPREIGATVVVRFRVKDLRSGDILIERPRFIHQESYMIPLGESFEVGMVRAMDGLAQRIVETMEEDW